MTYVRDHWHGRHALPRAFWINFLLPFVLIAMIEPWIRPAYPEGTGLQTIAVSLYTIIAHAVILPWQIVGLWRSSRRHLRERGDLGVVTFAQGAALIAVVTAAGATTSTVQQISGFGLDGTERQAKVLPRYTLSTRLEDQAILIDGPFDIGLSRDLDAILAETEGIEAIMLNSDGGRVFEARGIAKQIRDMKLDTFVSGNCRSACTIAFIAGETRKLRSGAQLGFHSYRLEAALAIVDPLEEQAKDRAFFLEQGVDPDFVDRAFSIPHDAMWHPNVDLLERAGVIREVRADQ